METEVVESTADVVQQKLPTIEEVVVLEDDPVPVHTTRVVEMTTEAGKDPSAT